MFEDLKYLLKEAELPDSVKLPLTVLLKAVTWFPWVFFFVGLVLGREFFLYWLAFFLFMEGILIAALIYVLVLIIQRSLPAVQPAGNSPQMPETFSEAALKGIIGNVAFYVALLAFFIVVKVMGVFDGLWQSLVTKLNP